MRATCLITVKKIVAYDAVISPESLLPRCLNPLGAAIVPSMSSRRSALRLSLIGLRI